MTSAVVVKRFFSLVILSLTLTSVMADDVGDGKLVVVVSVDQMRADYLYRFRNEFRGGLRRLSREGAYFVDAHQNHATTETGPGHSTLLTGIHPGHNGIIGNQWFDRVTEKMVYCVDSSSHNLLGSDRKGASPENLRVTALGDWLKDQSPDARVISVSRKDRSAVLMGGQHPDQVYWFDTNEGQFVTSDYYTTEYPSWVAEWRQEGLIDSYFGRTWDRLSKKPRRYPVGDPDVSGADFVVATPDFVHRFDSETGRPDRRFYGFLITTPFFDEITLKFAEAAIAGEGLGRRNTMDLLCIGLSATDSVGHTFGPHSEELRDQLLRLDGYLDSFLKNLNRTLGSKDYIVVLTADHGVQPYPELVRRTQSQARRVGQELGELKTGLTEHLNKVLGPGEWLVSNLEAGGVYCNDRLLAERQITRRRVVETVVEYLKNQPLIAGYYTRDVLTSAAPTKDPFLERFRNNYDPARSGDVMVRLQPFALPSSRPTGTTHGSPYGYDSQVPLIFWGKPFKRGHYAEKVATVDIAPTLAHLLGLHPPDSLDGRVLAGILKSSW